MNSRIGFGQRESPAIKRKSEKSKKVLLTSSTVRSHEEASLLIQAVSQGVLSPSEALLKIHSNQIIRLLSSRIEDAQHAQWITRAYGVSPGCASGKACFSSHMAMKTLAEGDQAILILPTTHANDTEAMRAVQGIITLRGGVASHAAVIARAWSKPCIVGASQLVSDEKKMIFQEGEGITLDGLTGDIWLGQCSILPPDPEPFLSTILQWTDLIRGDKIGIYVNADTCEELIRAIDFGAEGVGVCRTEHMFLRQDRLPLIRRVILTQEEEAFRELRASQRHDFKQLFSLLEKRPITVRLLDAPLHEFLYQDEAKEENPMLGLRGIRLAIQKPILYRMQMEALFEACQECWQEGKQINLEVMVPLVACIEELKQAHRWFENIRQSFGLLPTSSIRFGTMIETPRAALLADHLAEEADFFSFGTNDLTQMTYGFSRDDMHTNFLETSLIDLYLKMDILKEDPFNHLDIEGVGALMQMAIAKGKASHPDLKVGVCGEQASSCSAISFFLNHQIDYISCSPSQLPLARFNAALAILKKYPFIGEKELDRTPLQTPYTKP